MEGGGRIKGVAEKNNRWKLIGRERGAQCLPATTAGRDIQSTLYIFFFCMGRILHQLVPLSMYLLWEAT